MAADEGGGVGGACAGGYVGMFSWLDGFNVLGGSDGGVGGR